MAEKSKLALLQEDSRNSVLMLVRYSQSAAKDSLRLLLTIVSSFGNQEVGCLDINTAFLYAKKNNRNVYFLPPPEFAEKNNLGKL